MYVVAKSHLKVYLAMTCSKVSSALQDISIGDGAADVLAGPRVWSLYTIFTASIICSAYLSM